MMNRLLCKISTAVYSRNSFNTTRLFSTLKPELTKNTPVDSEASKQDESFPPKRVITSPLELVELLSPQEIEKLQSNYSLLPEILNSLNIEYNPNAHSHPSQDPLIHSIDQSTYLPPPRSVRKVTDLEMKMFRDRFNDGEDTYQLAPPLIGLGILALGFVSYLQIRQYFRNKEIEEMRARRLAEVEALEAQARADAEKVIQEHQQK